MSSRLTNPYSKGDNLLQIIIRRFVSILWKRFLSLLLHFSSLRISSFLTTWSILVSSSSRMAGSALLSQLQSSESWYCDFVFCLSHNEATTDFTGVEKAQIVYCSIAHERSIRDDMQLNTLYWNEILRFQAPVNIRFQLWEIVKPTRLLHFLRFINHIVPS